MMGAPSILKKAHLYVCQAGGVFLSSAFTRSVYSLSTWQSFLGNRPLGAWALVFSFSLIDGLEPGLVVRFGFPLSLYKKQALKSLVPTNPSHQPGVP